jgi:glycosyltransferase involved in cell wall biosynthesis
MAVRPGGGAQVSYEWPVPPPPVVPPEELPESPGGKRVKVLHVITRFVAGAGGNTLLTALGTDRERYEVWVAGAPEGPLWERAEANGIKTVRMRRFREFLAPLDDLIVLMQLIRLMRRERFTIVHTHSSKGGVLGRLAAWVARTPVVIHTIHGFSAHDFMGRGRRWSYLTIERMIRPLTDEIIAVAPQVAREAVEQRLARSGGVAVVPSAVELAEIPAEGDPAMRTELGLAADAPLVGTVGRLDHQKAPLDFVRMAAEVATAMPRTSFAMVGDGPLLEDARREAERLGVDIVFTGFRPDAARIAAGFDVFVISSLYEGLGRALTEALASCRPVVATAVNGVVDLVHHGSTGLLAPPADPSALARNVLWLLGHPSEAEQMGRAGSAQVRTLFEPRTMCALIQATYARLLGLPDRDPAGDPLGDRPSAESVPDRLGRPQR